MKQIELWRDVKGFEGLYKVSNFGRVKNSKGLIMKQRYDKDGYKRISLTKRSNGKKINKTFTIHRLVAINFIENPNNYECVNHIDENKENNFVSNLEWCTRGYNNTYGSRKNNLTRKARRVIDITNNIVYESLGQAGKSNNVSAGAIYNCCSGKSKTSNGNVFLFYDDYLAEKEVS